MSSTGVRDENSNEKRVIKGLIKNEEQFIQSLRVFANTSTLSGLGATEGDSNNSPIDASGNFLSKSGDIMVGQFGNQYDAINATNIINDTLDVSKTSGITFPVVILQGESPPDPDDLVNIIQGDDVFPFQELWIRTRSSVITIKNSGNVNTPDGNDLVLPVGSIIKLLFDNFLGEWVIVSGTALSGGGGSGITFPIDYPELDEGTVGAITVNLEFSEEDRESRKYTLNGDINFAFNTPPTDKTAYADIIIEQDGTGEHTVTLPGGTINKAEVEAAISTNPNAITTITIKYAIGIFYAFLRVASQGGGTSGGPDMGGDQDGIDGVGQWVYDGRVASGNHITKKWELGTPDDASDNGPNDIIWLPPIGNTPGRLVVVGDSNLAKNGAWTQDLANTWTTSLGISSNDNYIRSAYDIVGNILVAVASNGSISNVKQISTDRGSNFANVASPNADWHNDIIWSANDSQFLATCFTIPLATAQIRGIQTSPDGSTWTVRTTPIPNTGLGSWKFIAYSTSLGLYVATTSSNDDVMTSPDGINWTAHTTNISLSLHSRLIYSPGQDKFVLVGRTSLTEINSWTSKDGINWTKFTVDTFANGQSFLNDVVWSPDLSMYVAVGQSTASGFNAIAKIWVSNDGENWTRISRQVLFQTSTGHLSVTYAEEYGQFFVISGTSGITIWRTFR